MRSNTLICISMLIIYILSLAISLQTPMHSDDYWYSLIGMSPIKHYEHYMGWSGRIVADYTSTLLLSVKNHSIRAAINSLAITSLIYNISMIPSAVCRDISKNKIAIIALFIFLLYWIANPALGQTAFWVVGSANYLWTSLFVILFLRVTLKSKENVYSFELPKIALFLVGMLAGCSNENTSVTLVLICISLLFYYRVTDGKFDAKIICAFSGAVSGSLLLILAPGNFVRASGSSLEAWRDSSLASKIFTHITKTMPDAISQNWIAIVYLLILLSLVLVLNKQNKKTSLLVICFIGAFLCAHMVMVLSPVYPPRAIHGPFVFLLCAIALTTSMITGPNFKYAIILLLLPCILYFIPSYACMYTAYNHTMKQDLIRVNIIKDAIGEGKNDVTVPRFYFRGLVKGGDMFDVYHSPDMGRYYGISKTSPEMVPFDYSVISDGCKFNLDATIYGVHASCLYAYNDKFKNETVFIIKIDRPLEFKGTDQKWISIKGKEADGKYFKLPSVRAKSFLIGKDYYVYSKLKHSKDLNIESFMVAELDSSTGRTGNYYNSL